MVKLGQNFPIISIPERGFRIIKVFICGKDVAFEDFSGIPLSSSSLQRRSSLSNMANACCTLLFCPLFASILSRDFRFSRKSSIPTVVTLAQLLSTTEPKVYEKIILDLSSCYQLSTDNKTLPALRLENL